MRTWQHEDTGRITECEESPGPRWHEIPSQTPEIYSDGMTREDDIQFNRQWDVGSFEA